MILDVIVIYLFMMIMIRYGIGSIYKNRCYLSIVLVDITGIMTVDNILKCRQRVQRQHDTAATISRTDRNLYSTIISVLLI